MYFKNYELQNLHQIKSFIDNQNVETFSLHFLDQRSAVLAFDSNDVLVAVAMQVRNDLHPNTIDIEICVHSDKRRQGIGAKIFDKLMQEFPAQSGDYALDLKCESSDNEVQLFAKSLGFEHYLSCFNKVFNIDELTLIDCPYHFMTLSEFYSLNEEENKRKVKEFHCSRYDRDHEPYLPLTKDQGIRFDYYNDGDIKYGGVILNGNKIIACSFAYLNIEEELDEDLENITGLHGYAIGLSKDVEASLVQALYSHQMRLLKKEGYQYIYIEVDSIESTSDLMLKWLPPMRAPLLRFQRKV
ncbi:GNAT family N-acetyltransferase [Halobacteriovorax sp. GFR7]|uniref:GNAT family N-acetyltransferase n=1 Tax=unclassified Halobacteriovorax TaxID=2639665 RepID=UPI003D96E4C3